MAFRVPERFRVKSGLMASSIKDGNNGHFSVPYGKIKYKKRSLFVVASDGLGWEHVSVSSPSTQKLPTWDEMNFIKDLFWGEEDTVVQFHPPKSEYVDNAAVLHLWRKVDEDFETPPSILVGVKKNKTGNIANIQKWNDKK